MVRPGYTVYASVTYNGNGTATYWLEDLAANTYTAFANGAPYVGFGSANFINGRVGSLYSLNFDTTGFVNGNFANSSSYWNLSTCNNLGYM